MAEVNSEAVVLAHTDLLGFVSIWRLVAEEEKGMGAQVGGHADIAETSEFIHLHPELLRPKRVEAGRTIELDAKALDQIFKKGLRAVSQNGVLGDPRGADAELGEKLLNATVRAIADSFE